MNRKIQTLIRVIEGNGIVLMTVILVALTLQMALAREVAGAATRIAYWQLEESGAPYQDAAATQDGQCAAAGCPTMTASGLVTNGQQFNGASGIDVAANAAFDWGVNSDFSIELWVKADSAQTCVSGEETLIGRSDSGSGVGYWSLGCAANGKASFQLGDSNGASLTLQSSRVITDGLWHHIVGMRDGVNGINALYVDGVDVVTATQNYSGNLAPTTANITMGYLEANAFFTGTLDEAALYNGLLPEADIWQHYYLARDYDGAACSTPVRVMPLGDSITRGFGTGDEPENFDYNVGYRRPLFLDLNTQSYYVDFVGSEINGVVDSGTPFDYDHEGHGGVKDGWIATNVYNFLNNNPADVILLHIGTNALHPSPTDVENILKEIDRYSEDITVILARIVDQWPNDPDVTAFNNNIEAMAQARMDSGDKIIIVDMQSALTYDATDMYDTLHPNQNGYNKMSDVWLDVLNDFLPVCDYLPTIWSTPEVDATVGEPYTYTITASGSPAPTFSLEPPVPSGMTIVPETGIITWTPPSTGIANVIVRATNSQGFDEQNYTITVVDPVSPAITSTPITQAAINVPYYYDVTATGSPTFTLITTPTTSMNIGLNSGVIDWIPTALGTYTVTVTAANNWGTDEQTFDIAVTSSSISCPLGMAHYWPLDETSGTVFADFYDGRDASFLGAGSPVYATGIVTGAIDFDGTDDHLATSATTDVSEITLMAWVNPDDMTSHDRGIISKDDAFILEIESEGNEVSFTILNGATFDEFESDVVANEIMTGTWTHIAATYDGTTTAIYINGDLVASEISDMSAIGSSANPYHIGWTAEPDFGTNRYFDGRIDEVAVFSAALSAAEIQSLYDVGLGGAGLCTDQAPAIFSTPTTEVAVSQSYSYDVDATGNPPPTYTLTTAPAGMTIISGTGVIAWTPDITGTFGITVAASNVAGTDWQNFDIAVTEVPAITSAPTTQVGVNQTYNYDVNADGYPAPTYRLTTAPAGMTVGTGTGVISWTPTVTGTYDVVVEASNAVGVDSQNFSVIVTAVPAITSSPLLITGLSQLYTYDVNASGYPTPTFALTIAPTGMTIISDTGVISWTPIDTGSFSVAVEASNIIGTDLQSFAITVTEAVVINSSPVTVVGVGQPYSYDVNATGFPAPTFALTDKPDAGMTIDPDTGVISWTPSATGVFNVTVEAANSFNVDLQSFSVTVFERPSITSTPVLEVKIGQPYSYTVMATGYPTPTFALTVNPDPGGMTIDPDTGVISWTPDMEGVFSVTVEADGGLAGTDEQSFDITVSKYTVLLPIIVSN